MEIEKPSFEKDLWGQCSKLHERLNKKIEYYKNLRKIFEPIHKLFTELNKKLSSMKLNMDPTISVDLYSDSKTMRSTSMDLGTKWYGVPLTMKIIKEFISITVDLNMQTLFNIVKSDKHLLDSIGVVKSFGNKYGFSLRPTPYGFASNEYDFNMSFAIFWLAGAKKVMLNTFYDDENEFTIPPHMRWQESNKYDGCCVRCIKE